MPRYEDKAVSFDVPRDWEDNSVVIFSAPKKEKPSSLVMNREPLGKHKELAAFCDHHLVQLAKQLDSFRLGKRHEVPVSGQPAIEIQFSWRGERGALEQRVLLDHETPSSVLCLTATMDKAEVARVWPIVDRIFASIQLVGSKPQ